MNNPNAWQQTFSGRAFYPLDPRPEDVSIVDIAHALSLQCRFGGHCNVFYSVAEHSVRASKIAEEQGHEPQVVLATLLHDASEAYCVDVPRPIKPHLVGYAEIEEGVHRAICAKFGIDPKLAHSDVVKLIDNIMLATEKRDLMKNPPPKEWATLPLPNKGVIMPWTSEQAERAFLDRFALVTS